MKKALFLGNKGTKDFLGYLLRNFYKNQATIFIFFLFLSSIFFCGCNSGTNNGYGYESIMDMEYDIAPETKMEILSSSTKFPDKFQQKKEIDKKKIIKDGRMGIKTSDLEKSKNQIDTLVLKHKGYYSNEMFDNNDYASTYNLTIRLPSSVFENFVAAIEHGEAEIMYKNITARDVTEEFIDLETRLENKTNYLKRYGELLKQAKNVKDILEIEDKTRVIEEEIESVKGRLKYLSDLIDYSTLDLMITKEKGFKYQRRSHDNFSERLKQSLSRGWYGFVGFLLFIVRLWPFWIILTIGLLLYKKYMIKKKSKS